MAHGTYYGIFNEGLIQGDFLTLVDAQMEIATNWDDDDEVYAAEICREHGEQPAYNCEFCNCECSEEY